MAGLAALVFLAPLPARGVGVQGVAVAPPRFELVLCPCETVSREVAVFAQAPGVDAQTIVPSVVSWSLTPEGNVVVYEQGRPAPPYSAAPWIETAYDPFRLEPDEPVVVGFQISVPEGTLEGSYYAALAFTTEPRPGEHKGVAVLVNTRMLVIVYATIRGTEQPAAELQGVTVVTDEASGRRYLVADVVNTGNVYLRLNGELRFVDTTGEVARRLELPERVLLREGLVRYRLAFPDDLPGNVILTQIEIQPQGPAEGYGGPPLYGEAPVR